MPWAHIDIAGAAEVDARRAAGDRPAAPGSAPGCSPQFALDFRQAGAA